MLLQKTSWRIKQLISHRKNNDFESRSNKLEDIFVQSEPQAGAAKRLSWKSRSPHGSSEFSLLGRTSTAQTRHSPQISKSTHSSVSSLCSCCDANLGANRPLSPGHLHPESLCFPPPTTKQNSDDGKASRLVYSDQRSTRPAPSLSKLDIKSLPATTIVSISSPTFDLLEALGLEPVDEGKTPTQIRRPSDETQTDIADNVEELIRETDEAFWAVGIALADAKAATEGWYDSDPRLIECNIKKPKFAPRKIRTPTSSIKVSMARSLSGSKPKPKRRKSTRKKKTLLGRTTRNIPPPPTNSPRWTLADVTTNVADVLSGKRFRIEADEMLTEERIQRLKSQSEIRFAAESRAESRASMDSAQSVNTEESTPTDPFHLESFSSRIAAAQNAAAIPAPARPPPEVPEKKTPAPSTLVEQRAEMGMAFKNLKFPDPLRRLRRNPVSQSLPLPTILESSPFPGRTTVLLPSTHFTLTSPLFRHGPIRIERAVGEPKESQGEEALDWTAFHMAISGTMDDGRTGNEWEGDEAGLEDIVDWWKGFGFQGYGKMERFTVRPGTKPIRRTNKGRSQIACPVPVRTLKPLPALREAMIGREKARIDTNTMASEGLAGTKQGRVSLAESLPPSPMLDLVLRNPSRDDEVIPMGFNLGHDLGDFLNWETHHVQTLFIDD